MVEGNEFSQGPGDAVAIPVLLTIVRVGLEDKIAQVFMTAIMLLELVLPMLRRYARLPATSPFSVIGWVLVA